MSLRADWSEPHLHEDSRREELAIISELRGFISSAAKIAYRDGVSVVHDREIHQDTAVNLPIAQYPFVRSLVETIHPRISNISSQPCDQ